MKIGNIDLGDRPLLLAPMEDVTDASFRFICKEFGADMMYTEFISSDGIDAVAISPLLKRLTGENINIVVAERLLVVDGVFP